MPKDRAPWREVLAQRHVPKEDTLRTSCYRTNAKLDELLKRAAEARGMSTTGYTRRAAIAVAVHDLGEDWFEAMDGEPGFGLYGTSPGRSAIYADGEGFGPWKITGLESHGDRPA